MTISGIAARPRVAAGHDARAARPACPASIDQASRTNCACVQASGVAESVPARRPERGARRSAAGRPTPARAACGRRSPPPAIVAQVRARRRPAGEQLVLAALAGQQRPRAPERLPEPVGRAPTGRRRASRRSRRSVDRCQNGPLGVATPSSPVDDRQRVDGSSGRRRRFTPSRTSSRKLGSTTSRWSIGGPPSPIVYVVAGVRRCRRWSAAGSTAVRQRAVRRHASSLDAAAATRRPSPGSARRRRAVAVAVARCRPRTPGRRSRRRSSPASSRSAFSQRSCGVRPVRDDEVRGAPHVRQSAASVRPSCHASTIGNATSSICRLASAACRRVRVLREASRRAAAGASTGSPARGRAARVSPAASSAGGDLVEVARPDEVVRRRSPVRANRRPTPTASTATRRSAAVASCPRLARMTIIETSYERARGVRATLAGGGLSERRGSRASPRRSGRAGARSPLPAATTRPARAATRCAEAERERQRAARREAGQRQPRGLHDVARVAARVVAVHRAGVGCRSVQPSLRVPW